MTTILYGIQLESPAGEISLMRSAKHPTEPLIMDDSGQVLELIKILKKDNKNVVMQLHTFNDEERKEIVRNRFYLNNEFIFEEGIQKC